MCRRASVTSMVRLLKEKKIQTNGQNDKVPKIAFDAPARNSDRLFGITVNANSVLVL